MSRKLLKVAATCFLLIAGTSACASAGTQPAQSVDEPPRNVLFVGNSFTYYNNGLHKHYRALIRAAYPDNERAGVVRIMTISGGYLPEHAGGMPMMIASQQWDVVVMHGHSLGPISEDTAEPFRKAARDYSGVIREHGARPVFFMTWAYTGKPEMTALIDDAYTSIGRELNAEVVPVGLAFATVTSERPDVALRIADARHPTLEGTYLAACMFFSAFHGRTAEGVAYTAELNPEVAQYLQETAWQTLQAYRERESRK